MGPEPWLTATERPPSGACGGSIASSCNCAGVYFYLSIPFLLALVLAAGGFLIYAFFAFGHIPIRLVLLVGLAVVVTITSILRSLFVRTKEVEPGVRLDLATEPRLAAALAEVAQQIGTPPVDHVYLVSNTDVAVFERGGFWRGLTGKRERCLILGVGVLDGLGLRALLSVLGHEHGHLRNQDTAGGGFAFAVRRSLEHMIMRIARSGAGAWYNPAWWFLRGFHRVYLRTSQGARRLQEILADRWAAIAYGSTAFVDGLGYIVARSVRFNAHARATIDEVVREKRPLANLYSYAPTGKLPADLDETVEKALASPPGPYDSHPSPRQRFEWVNALAAPGVAPATEPDATAWSLFASREKIERLMTDRLRGILRQRGVSVPDAE